jgi:hypothetical protein
VALRENFVRHPRPFIFTHFARKAYYRSYSKRERRWWAPSTRMVPGMVDGNGRLATRMQRRSSDGSCR